MFSDRISDYFEGVAAKYLSAVDADPGRSNQHEIGGLPAAGFKRYLGTPNKNEEYRFRARQIYIADDSLAPEIADGLVTWYDCRRKQMHRGPEFRLYYYNNSVTELLSEGDFLLVAKMRDGSLLMIFTPAGSTIENQLRSLFGIEHVDQRFTAGTLDVIELLLPLRIILEDLGLDLTPAKKSDDIWLDRLIEIFGGTSFPTTTQFSDFARKSIEESVDPLSSPDQAILDWMDHEEKLFRIYERHLVLQRLRQGFQENVDDFISFSLSVQNRRKSRVGYAFERHLSKIFTLHGLRFEQGGGKLGVTENNSKPDFLFPGFSEYRDSEYLDNRLVMLGAKTTCKDRWRQVLSEAHRVSNKHLVTLEPAITSSQTFEMRSHHLQLVVPAGIHLTYTEAQRSWLFNMSDFIEFAKERQ